MEEIRTKRQLKTWMQALMLAALLMFCPVSVLWTGEENQEPEERLTEGYAAESEEVSAREETTHPQERAPAEEKPRIALTFDDGPNDAYTPVLLDGLKERGARVTFFVIGANIEKEDNVSLIKRMLEEGHVIGNHTYHHVDLSEMDPADALKELDMTDSLIEDITGERPLFVRPPFGAFPQGREKEDKLYVKWTVDSEDWVTRNAEAVVRKVVTDAEENDIILMHDCYETSVEAALQIVDILQEKGYEFVTVEELLID